MPGGVLLDSRGKVIGINTAILDPSRRGANTGIGFAIPIHAIKGVVQQLIEHGRVMRPVLGIFLAPPHFAKRALGVDGALILEVCTG